MTRIIKDDNIEKNKQLKQFPFFRRIIKLMELQNLTSVKAKVKNK